MIRNYYTDSYKSGLAVTPSDTLLLDGRTKSTTPQSSWKQYNLYVGDRAGRNSTGYYNVVLGGQAGSSNDFGNSNVLIGYVAGRDLMSANNVMIGQGAGYNNTSEVGGNVFIGPYAGEDYSTEGNRLAISSDRSKPPLIYGEFDNQLVNISGTLQANGEVISPSDKRLKTNFVKLTNGLDIVQKLNSYYFDWNSFAIEKLHFKKIKQFGLIAQEVETVMPEIVYKSVKGYKAIDYSKLSPILIEAVKEQQKQIEDLKEKNNILSQQVSEIDLLKAEMNELKAMVKEIVGTTKESKSESAK